MIASVQIRDAEIFAFIAALVFKLLICKVLFINRKDNRNCKSHRQITAKLQILGMRNFQDTFEAGKRSFVSAISICMTVPLSLTSYNHFALLIPSLNH